MCHNLVRAKVAYRFKNGSSFIQSHETKVESDELCAIACNVHPMTMIVIAMHSSGKMDRAI